MLGIDIGPSETETFWTAFLRKLARRELRSVKLVISDAHEVIKAAVSRVSTSLGSAAVCTHGQRAGACQQERAPRRLRLHHLRLCPYPGRQGAAAQGR